MFINQNYIVVGELDFQNCIYHIIIITLKNRFFNYFHLLRNTYLKNNNEEISH